MTDDSDTDFEEAVEEINEELDRDLDVEELHQQSDPTADRSLTWRLGSFFVENTLLILGSFTLVGLLVLSYFNTGVPRWIRFVGIPAAVSLLTVGRPAGKRVKSMLWDPATVWLVDVDPLQREGAIFRMPSQRWHQWEVTDGQADWVTPHLAFVKNVDPAAQTCEGTWMGTLSDRELMRGLQEVYKCREMLEEDAKRGFAVDSQAWVIIRNATRKAVMRVVSTFERGTLPDEGDAIDDEINEAISQFDIERKIRRTEDDRSPDSVAPGTNGDGDDLDLEDVDLDDPNLLDLETAAQISRGGSDD